MNSQGLRKLALGALATGLCAAPARAADPPGARWQRLAAPAGIERAEALAIEGDRLAVGGERGVALGPLAGPLERVLPRGPVHDLVFAADGALFAATDVGLYRIEAPGRVTAERIAAGEAARTVWDLDAAVGRIVAATDAGVYALEVPGAADRSGGWQRVEGLPFGEARRVALCTDESARSVIWAVIDGALWRAVPGEGGVRVSLPSAAGGEGAVDLARGPAGELLVLLPRSLAIRTTATEWRTERLTLPPGSLPLRIAAEPGRLWLATDAGLLTAPGPAGPWQRTAPPAGHVAVAALAGAGDRLVVATAHGLLRHAPAAQDESAEAAPLPPVPAGDPPVLQVQRVALRYLALEPLHMQELSSGAARRGWLPQLNLRVAGGRDRDRGIDFDQDFVSGETRYLVDRDRADGQDYAASLELSWDFGDAAFHPYSIDVSRESRLVTQLRDDVLDEINQLYFERQRVLAALDAPPPETSVTALRLRAAELASGLDAWTGGWFGAQVAPSPSRSSFDGPGFPAQEPSP